MSEDTDRLTSLTKSVLLAAARDVNKKIKNLEPKIDTKVSEAELEDQLVTLASQEGAIREEDKLTRKTISTLSDLLEAASQKQDDGGKKKKKKKKKKKEQVKEAQAEEVTPEEGTEEAVQEAPKKEKKKEKKTSKAARVREAMIPYLKKGKHTKKELKKVIMDHFNPQADKGVIEISESTIMDAFYWCVNKDASINKFPFVVEVDDKKRMKFTEKVPK